MEQKVYHKGARQAFDEQTLSSIAPILEGMPGGLFIYYADGDEELLYVNSAVLRYLRTAVLHHHLHNR